MIDKNYIVIPGHTGDFISGGRLIKVRYSQAASSLEGAKLLYEFHGHRVNLDRDVVTMLHNIIEDIRKSYDVSLSDAIESIEWRERQVKFIVNSLRVYEYFGINWRIPLWDCRLFFFFSQLDNRLRYNQRLYLDVARDIFSKYNINFSIFQRVTSSSWKRSFKTFLRNIADELNITSFIKEVYRSILSTEDKWAIMPHLKRKKIRKFLKIPSYFKKYGFCKKGKEINAIVSDWTFAVFYKKYKDKIYM